MDWKLPEWWDCDKPYKIMDCLTGMKSIPDNSIDMVFTDPPYSKEYIYLYESTAKEYKRILKEGGYAFIYASDYYFPDCFNSVLKHLDFYYLFHLLTTEGNCARVFPKKLQIGCKTLMAFSKGIGGEHEWAFNTIRSRIERGLHPWQQSFEQAKYVIEYFTNEGNTILDPFLGTGTTLLSCRYTNRVGLGFDDNGDNLTIIQKRIMEAIPRIETWGDDVPESCLEGVKQNPLGRGN